MTRFFFSLLQWQPMLACRIRNSPTTPKPSSTWQNGSVWTRRCYNRFSRSDSCRRCNSGRKSRNACGESGNRGSRCTSSNGRLSFNNISVNRTSYAGRISCDSSSTWHSREGHRSSKWGRTPLMCRRSSHPQQSRAIHLHLTSHWTCPSGFLPPFHFAFLLLQRFQVPPQGLHPPLTWLLDRVPLGLIHSFLDHRRIRLLINNSPLLSFNSVSF